MQAQQRINKAKRALPVLVEIARANFRNAAEVRAAVLVAWTALAGVVGWTPAMVEAVDREVQA